MIQQGPPLKTVGRGTTSTPNTLMVNDDSGSQMNVISDQLLQ